MKKNYFFLFVFLFLFIFSSCTGNQGSVISADDNVELTEKDNLNKDQDIASKTDEDNIKTDTTPTPDKTSDTDIIVEPDETSDIDSTVEPDKTSDADSVVKPDEITDTDSNNNDEDETQDIDVVVPSNLIKNGSFEDWNGAFPDGWGGSATTISTGSTLKFTTSSKSGKNSCQLIDSGSKYKRFSSLGFDSEVGNFECSFWVRGHGEIRPRYFNETTQIYAQNYPPYQSVNSTDWTKITYPFTTKTKGKIQLVFYVRLTNSDKEHIQIDDVVCLKK